MSDPQLATEALILQTVEQVEKRASERETKRFRVLYAVVAALSFIGMGVIAQLIDFYSTRAVEQRLEQSRQELDSARIYSQLLALATQLDMRTSFSNTDRDSIVRLLDKAKDNKRLRAEPAFDSLLQKILRSFSASDNSTFVARIFDDYQSECLRIPGVVEILLQHYAKRILASTDLEGDISVNDLKRFQMLADAADTFRLQGATAALRSFIAFQRQRSKPTDELRRLLVTYSAFDEEAKAHFTSFVEQFSDPKKLSRKVRPDDVRISDLTKAFRVAYRPELKSITPAEQDETSAGFLEAETMIRRLLDSKE